MAKCHVCGHAFASLAEVLKHILTDHISVMSQQLFNACLWKYQQLKAECPMCGVPNDSHQRLIEHIQTCPESVIHFMQSLPTFHCTKCYCVFHHQRRLNAHMLAHNNMEPFQNEYGSIVLRESAFGRAAAVYEVHPIIPFVDVMHLLLWVGELFQHVLNRDYPQRDTFRGNIHLTVTMVKYDEVGNVKTRENFHFQTSFSPFSLLHDSFNLWLSEHIQQLTQRITQFSTRGSNWIVEKISNVEFKVLATNMLSGGCATPFQLPPKLKAKHAVININSENDECFLYAVVCALHFPDLHQKKNLQHKRHYIKWLHEINMENITYPVTLSSMKQFERNNPTIKLNIHLWDDGRSQPLYNTANSVGRAKVVNLLLVHDKQTMRSHFCPIKDLQRLVNSHPEGDVPRQRHKICDRCYRFFNKDSIHLFDCHQKFCLQNKPQVEEMPKNPIMKFDSFHTMLSPAFVAYADIEAYIDDSTGVHTPAMVGVYVVLNPSLKLDSLDKSLRELLPSTKIKVFVGETCVQEFLEYIDNLVKNIYLLDQKSFLFRQKKNLSRDEMNKFMLTRNCYICNLEFDNTSNKVQDHDHYTGLYRGAACQGCNTKLRMRRCFLPIFFHNLRGYDMHHLCKHGFGNFPSWTLSPIPTTREKYLALTAQIKVGAQPTNGRDINFCVKFLDSFQFLSTSLAKLASTLPKFEHALNLIHEYPNVTRDIIERKGLFPYEYFNSLDRLSDMQLPSKPHFYDSLSEQHVTDEEYAHAQKAWDAFHCTSFGEYTQRYLELDVYLLADIFEHYRKTCFKTDGLDPTHFFTSPGYSFTAALKQTNEEIELLQDPQMHELFERGIRGGMCFTNKHFIHANNPYMDNDFDPIKPTKWLLYIDENNLYGNALSQRLPHSNFQWIDQNTLQTWTSDTILQLDDDGEIGYLCEVDLEYPDSLHDYTSDLPFAPERKQPDWNMFPFYMKQFWNNICTQRGKPFSERYISTEKLLLTVENKYHYVVHYVLLKYYLQKGLILQKIHRAIQFTQKKWLEPFISANTEKRSSAQTTFEKDYYKLRSNSVFGKTMENVRKHQTYKLVNTPERLQHATADLRALDCDIFSENLVGIKCFKTKVLLDKPVYVGQAVLDYSKLTMYQLYYDFIKTHPKIISSYVAGGDTDSLFLELTTSPNVDLYNDILLEMIGVCFDSSNYSPDHFLYDASCKAKLGFFKDESCGHLVTEYVLLKPKMYSILTKTWKPIQKAKGIARSALRSITHEDYQNAWQTQLESSCKYNILKSTLHEISTTGITKRALSLWEDKRAWTDCNDSLPYGHYALTHERSSTEPFHKRMRYS